VLHDRDSKFCPSFDEIIESGNVTPISLPARSPNLNSFSERWVKSVKEECLSRLILFGESSLRASPSTIPQPLPRGTQIIRGKIINDCFLARLYGWMVIRDRFNVRNDWEVS
jgi:hypothetical protein